ncbi:interferon lambda-2-like [Eleutherodactylus coqui]|uniref:interferon lambda-2-like n=1 Tax=Eleutherodactylus coqui TaxID=57060 RepID=UPI00346312B0
MGRLKMELRSAEERHKTIVQVSIFCWVFTGREESLQIGTDTPAMDIRLVVFSILLLAVTANPLRRPCRMSRYKSVSSDDMTVIKELQNEHEKNMSTDAIKCYRRMMRHKPSVCDLTPSDRLIFTLKRVSVTVDVLENMSTSAAADPGSQSLRIFLQLRDDLMICKVSPGFNTIPSKQLKPWLHHLQHFMDEASPQCLQDAMLLSLISLMVEDVGCWAHGKKLQGSFTEDP